MRRKKNSIKKVAQKYVFIGKFYTIFSYVRLMTQKESKNKSKLLHAINTFIEKEKLSDKKYLKKVTFNMLFSKLVYRITFDEYFIFDFEKLSEKGRRSFIGNYEKDDICNLLGTAESKLIFSDKFMTYKTFERYYKRDIIKISDQSDYTLFENYVKGHNDFMVKPISKSLGKGIYHINMQKEKVDIRELFERILETEVCVLEERIQQVPEMAMFHPFSVNTIRLTTIIQNNVVTNCYSFFRMGRGNNVVDNAGAGGIFATVDIATGIVITLGISETGECYINHPDTGVKIIGYQIPQWDKLLELAEELARIVPEQQYVGWDLALTNEGWVVVEGNGKGQLLHQYANKAGYRIELEKILGNKMKGL